MPVRVTLALRSSARLSLDCESPSLMPRIMTSEKHSRDDILIGSPTGTRMHHVLSRAELYSTDNETARADTRERQSISFKRRWRKFASRRDQHCSSSPPTGLRAYVAVKSASRALYGQVPASGSKWPSFLIVEVFLERLGIARFGQAQHQQNACLLRTQIVRQHTSNLPQRKR
jgi:hypothetical protein